MIEVDGFAKVNLSLRLRSRDSGGYHPIRSLVQSIGWADRLRLAFGDDDELTITGGQPAPTGQDNLAWRAAAAIRERVGSEGKLSLTLDKQIPAEAGLAGGSADAAAGLVAATRLLGGDGGLPTGVAPTLGSDVPFCVVGGLAWMEGRGELITPVRTVAGYALAVAVPSRWRLSTAEVYRRWDVLGEPAGPSLAAADVPPALRELDPLGNDLTPAAIDLASDFGDWMADVARSWDRPVLMTGSGTGAFGFFVDEDEAQGAMAGLDDALVWAGAPETVGTRVVEG